MRTMLRTLTAVVVFACLQTQAAVYWRLTTGSMHVQYGTINAWGEVGYHGYDIKGRLLRWYQYTEGGIGWGTWLFQRLSYYNYSLNEDLLSIGYCGDYSRTYTTDISQPAGQSDWVMINADCHTWQEVVNNGSAIDYVMLRIRYPFQSVSWDMPVGAGWCHGTVSYGFFHGLPSDYYQGVPYQYTLQPHSSVELEEGLRVWAQHWNTSSGPCVYFAVGVYTRGRSNGHITYHVPGSKAWQRQRIPFSRANKMADVPGLALIAANTDIASAIGVASNANPTGIAWVPGANRLVTLDYADGLEGSQYIVALSGTNLGSVSSLVTSNALWNYELGLVPSTNDYGPSTTSIVVPPREALAMMYSTDPAEFKAAGTNVVLMQMRGRLHGMNGLTGTLTPCRIPQEMSVSAFEPQRGATNNAFFADHFNVYLASNLFANTTDVVCVHDFASNMYDFARANGWSNEELHPYAPAAWEIADIRQASDGSLFVVLDSRNAESLLYHFLPSGATNILRTAPVFLGKYVSPHIRTLLVHPTLPNIVYLYLEDRTSGSRITYIEEYNTSTGASRTVMDGDTFQYYVQQITGAPIETGFRMGCHGLCFGEDGRIYMAESGFERYAGNLLENATRSVWAINPAINIPAHPKLPVVVGVSNAVVGEAQTYLGPGPALLTQGTAPITWRLLQGPPGMTMDARGMLTWSNATCVGSPFTIIIEATNAAGSAQQTWPLRVATLQDALDTDLACWTSVSNGWFPQAAVAWYDMDAAQSGAVLTGQTSKLYMEVPGPADFSFYWKLTSDRYDDFVSFWVDGGKTAELYTVSSTDWHKREYTLLDGVHTVAWVYARGTTGGSALNCAWVDQATVPEPAGMLAAAAFIGLMLQRRARHKGR